MPPFILRRPQVEACTGLSRSTLYAMMAGAQFRPPDPPWGSVPSVGPQAAISDWLDSPASRATLRDPWQEAGKPRPGMAWGGIVHLHERRTVPQ